MDNATFTTTAADEARLSEYDFIVCVDASGSMSEEDCPGNRSRWDYMQETMLAFTRDISKIDTNGIDLITFGGDKITSDLGVNVDKVKEVFSSRQPRGATPMTDALTEALRVANKSSKKAFVMVYTDGRPDDEKTTAEVIRKQANAQETDDRCTILFVQVGKDPQATRYLQKLDDDLQGAKFDIVDAKTIEQAEKFPTTAALVLHAISD